MTKIAINENERDVTARVTEFTGPVGFEDMPNKAFEAGLFLVSPLFDEVSVETIRKVKERSGAIIALDIQGFMRNTPRRGCAFLSDSTKRKPQNLAELMHCVDILKCNERELSLLSTKGTIQDKMLGVAELGPGIILTTMGADGQLLLVGGKFYRTKPLKIESAKHTVGHGDRLFSLFLAHFVRTGNPVVSAENANREVLRHAGCPVP